MKTLFKKLIITCSHYKMNMKQTLLIILVGLSLAANAIKPEREYKWTPETHGLSFAEYQTKTADSYSINIWEYALPDSVKSDRTIILVGTDAGNMGFLIWQAKALLKQGMRVIAFDYRGFGKSADFEINADMLFYPEFSLDLDSVIKSTRNKYPKDKIGLYAMSMGTHVSLLAKEKVDYMIAEGFYHNPQKVVDRIKVNKGKTILLPVGATTIDKLNRKIPVLIFCATNDKTTVTEDAKEFGKKNKVELVEFEGDHLSGMLVMKEDEYGDLYAARIAEFLNHKL